jgi:hypothetical protein
MQRVVILVAQKAADDKETTALLGSTLRGIVNDVKWFGYDLRIVETETW